AEKTWQASGITQAQAVRIQNAATRTRQIIYLVGSRASGTAGANSDWDYFLTGNSAQRHSAVSKLPGYMTTDLASQSGLGPGVTNTGHGIDIFHSYCAVGGYYVAQFDQTRDYVQFEPQ